MKTTIDFFTNTVKSREIVLLGFHGGDDALLSL
jgi:hypothetical protein